MDFIIFTQITAQDVKEREKWLEKSATSALLKKLFKEYNNSIWQLQLVFLIIIKYWFQTWEIKGLMELQVI